MLDFRASLVKLCFQWEEQVCCCHMSNACGTACKHLSGGNTSMSVLKTRTSVEGCSNSTSRQGSSLCAARAAHSKSEISVESSIDLSVEVINDPVSKAQNKSPKPFSESFLIRSIIPCIVVSISARREMVFLDLTYLGHYRFSIFPFHISEGHLSAFILVYPQLWVINVRDFLEWNYEMSIEKPLSCKILLTLFLDHHSRYSHCCIRSHLLWTKSSAFESFLSQLGGPIYSSSTTTR